MHIGAAIFEMHQAYGGLIPSRLLGKSDRTIVIRVALGALHYFLECVAHFKCGRKT